MIATHRCSDPFGLLEGSAWSGKAVTAFRRCFDGDRITAIDLIADTATIADLGPAVPEYSDWPLGGLRR